MSDSATSRECNALNLWAYFWQFLGFPMLPLDTTQGAFISSLCLGNSAQSDIRHSLLISQLCTRVLVAIHTAKLIAKLRITGTNAAALKQEIRIQWSSAFMSQSCRIRRSRNVWGALERCHFDRHIPAEKRLQFLEILLGVCCRVMKC